MSRVQEQDAVDLAQPARSMLKSRSDLDRRRFLGRVGAAGVGAGALAIGARAALAQADMGSVAPPSTVTTRRAISARRAPNVYFWDADVIAVDPSFNGLAQPNAPIQRLWTGALWAEGPAWNSVGKFLVWSDIPNNRQLRWIEDDGHVSVFRMPSNNSNGNTFDFQGRQISCEHLTRRVVRYELDGSITVLADSWNGKRLNSPNDAVPHPDGSVWFTDRPTARSSTKAPPIPPAARATRRAGSTTGSVSRSGSVIRSRSCPPRSIGGTRAAASTW